jgi:hypothetical protein
MGKQQMPGSYFAPWLRRIARNLAFDHHALRSTKAERLTEDFASITDGAVTDDHATAAVESETLRVALSRLPERQRRVLAMRSANAGQRARAALGLTRPECADPATGPGARHDRDLWQADVLDRVPPDGLTNEEQSHLHLRRAGVWAAIAFSQSRRGESPKSAGERALRELAAVNKLELTDGDLVEFGEAAARVGASRWAAEAVEKPAGKLWVQSVAGPGAGETCVLLLDAKHDTQHPLMRRCTYATVWAASASSNAAGTALALAVQPLAAWRELWLFRSTPEGWTVAVIPPGTSNTDLGYLEFAGWVPGADRILAAREVKVDGRMRRRFEIISTVSLSVEHFATTPEYLSTFMRWQEPRWKRLTVALR